MMRRRHRVLARLLVARLTLGATLTACGTAQPSTAERPARAPTTAMRADTATIVVPSSFPAQVYVERDAIVAARSAGSIDSLFVSLGATVRAGDLLARIESRDQEIELARAQVGFERARSVVLRARELAKKGGVTVADSETVEYDLRQAEQAVRRAERDLELTRIVAPFAGVVSARYATPRRLVAAGDTLFRVAETSPQLVRVRVPEGAARDVRIGTRATVEGENGARRVVATVIHAAPVLDAASATREVILQLSAPRFLPGEGVSVRMGSERRRAIVAPRDAIAADGYALVVDGERTSLRAVTTGALVDGGRIEIVSGLAAGERLAKAER